MAPVVAIAPIDPVRAAELAGRATTWLAQVMAQRKDRRERSAAIILRELAMLSAWCHALNESGRAATQPLLRLSPEWSREDKERVVDGLDAFVGTAILSEINKCAAALEHLVRDIALGRVELDDQVNWAIADSFSERDADDVYSPTRRLTDALRRIADDSYKIAGHARGSDAATPVAEIWASLNSFQALEVPFRTARGEDWTKRAHEIAQSLRELAPPAWLDQLDRVLGSLRATIQLRYPKLPAADWLEGARPPAG